MTRKLLFLWLFLDQLCTGRYPGGTLSLQNTMSPWEARLPILGRGIWYIFTVVCPDSIDNTEELEQDLANYPFLRVGYCSLTRFCHLKQMFCDGS